MIDRYQPDYRREILDHIAWRQSLGWELTDCVQEVWMIYQHYGISYTLRMPIRDWTSIILALAKVWGRFRRDEAAR